MNAITFPLRTNQRGEAVAALHAALEKLIARGILVPVEGDARTIAAEHDGKRFGAATRRLVVAFQEAHRIEQSGRVDEATAEAMNSLLDAEGGGPQPEAFAEPEALGLRLLLREGRAGANVSVAQDILSGLGWRIAPWERERQHFGDSTRAAILAWRERSHLAPDAALDGDAFAQLLAQGRDLPRSVRGTISLDDGAPAAGLMVVAVDRDFRSEQTLGECVTDAVGSYRIGFTAKAFARAEKGGADLGLRILAADGRTVLREPSSADLLMNAPMDAVIDAVVAAPEGAVPSLFERIALEVRPLVADTAYGGIGVTPHLDEAIFLARETGFDIGEIAHFIVAHRLEEMSGVSAIWFFALLREDGLFGVGAGRPRVQMVPVGLESNTQVVLYEAVRLDAKLADAAVTRAIRKRIVPPAARKLGRAGRDKLRGFEKEAEEYGNGALRERVIATVEDLLEQDQAGRLARALTSLDIADAEPIFELIDASGSVAPADRDRTEARLELGALLNFDLGLIGAASTRATRGAREMGRDDVRALARLSISEWSEMIARATPEGGTSRARRSTSADRAQTRRQAAAVAGRFEKRFPTVSAAAQLGRAQSSALPEHRAVADFLDAHPALELRDNKLHPFLKEAGTDASAIKPEVKRSVEMLQRVLRLTGTFGKSEALLAAGYGASADIAAAGKSQFLADVKRTGGIAMREATQIFELAENNHLATVQLATNLRTLSWPRALEGASAQALALHIDQIVADQPDLASLFGDTDACQCEHCRSIYGPAAYFADVMRFLRDRLVKKAATPNLPGTRSAKDVLFARRPDLGEIDLNCNNALIEVPHIDIVCELAEERISPDTGFLFNGPLVLAAGSPSVALLTAVRAHYSITDDAILYGPYAANRFILRDSTIVLAIDGPGPNWNVRRLRQTHGTGEERAAAPEYVNLGAYQLLRSGKAAFGLPFDLFHAETRAFLSAAGINRAELMTALAVGGSPASQIIAGEALGLADAERQLVFSADVSGQPTIWAVIGVTAAPTMKRLDIFTQRTGLDFYGVEGLVSGRYVRGAANLFIRHLDNGCDLAMKEIVNLDDAALDRIHRLLRLARKTGLAIQDVDRFAFAGRLGGGDLGVPALLALSDLGAVSRDLGVGIDRLISWLDVIPTQGNPSPHATLFENPAVTGPFTADLSAVGLRANDAAPGAAPPLASANADLAIALSARLVDIDAMIARLAVLTGAVPPLTSPMIAALYGRLGLARALGLTVERLLTLEGLAVVDPLAGAATLLAFVRTARAVIATGVSIPEIAYRLARIAPDLVARDLADAPIAGALADLRTRLLAVRVENASPFDAGLAPGEQVEALQSLLGRQPQLKPETIAALALLIREGVPTAADGATAKAIVDAAPDALPDPGIAGLVDQVAVKAAIDALIALPGAIERNAYLKLVMDGLAASTIARLSNDIANSVMASLFAVPVERSAAILDGAKLMVAAVPTSLKALLTTGDVVNPAISLTVAAAPDLFRAARLGHAIAGLLAPFDPAVETVKFLFERAAGLGWMALDALPFETGVAPVPLAKWLEMVDALAFSAEFPPVDMPTQPGVVRGALDLFTMAAVGAAKADLLDAAAVVTGWRRSLLGDVDTHLAMAVADYRLPAKLRSVGRAVGFLNQLGLPLAEAVAFIQPVLGDAERGSARRMLSARYDPADWLGALKGIMDPIREAKRDALVAYLMADNPQLRSVADLYDYFLTDVLWSAKMPSSRLVHAHSTLQTFIQRCISGDEPDAVADLDGDQAWKWWDWMRNYRVWEVGRKVFVEAQYYLRPEWRDDKTEPFEAMESALLQNEINQENLEAAYEGYLDELDRIAFLDVLATCYDFDREQLHVIGATKGGDPRSYFHRVLERERVWTPWKRIDLDITGEHLIAFFRNKRLYLAWATFTEKGDENQNTVFPEPAGSGAQPLPPTYRWTEIKLAVSEYTGKKWLPRRVSEDAVKTQSSPVRLDIQRLFLTVSPGEKFTVDVCVNIEGKRRIGSFLLTGCKGYPEVVPTNSLPLFIIPEFEDTAERGQRLVEQDAVTGDRLAMTGVWGSSGFQTLFGVTPGIFRVTYPYQASEIDKLLSLFMNWAFGSLARDRQFRFFGTMMPFFFEDNRHGYILIPGFYSQLDPETGRRTTSKTFSNVRRLIVDVIALIVKYLTLWSAATTPAEQQAVADALAADPEVARIGEEFESYRGTDLGFVVRNFYHPLACFLREKFYEGGIPALLARKTQLEIGGFQFESASPGYDPDPIILPPYPREELEFGRESAYAAYNWELTFHAPHMIAVKLMEAGRFDEAEVWLRYIFDPLGSSNDPSPQRYWNTKPFFERDPADYGDQLISAIMDRLADDPTGAVETELADAVWEWRSNPFKPYLVARSRTVAFQQAIVHLTARLYLGRADQFFRRDQLEDLVMASLDYSRAERLLGRRPAIVPHAVTPPSETYNQLELKLDLFGNALRTLENLLPDLSVLPQDGAELPPPPLTLESLYFCIPPSDKMYELWDLLEERQFNLRNSRTIDGVERSLSIFAPPLSVEELIKASAAGLSVSAILSSLSAPRPPYRFRVMLRHAIELTEVATAFSQKMEAALSSRDMEGLARLKGEQEVRILAEQTKKLAEEVKIAGGNISSAKKARQIHLETQQFYEGRPYMNPWEIAGTVAGGISFGLQAVVAIGYAASGGLALVPRFMIGAAGFGGSPTANAQTGGQDYSSSARDFVVGAVGALASAFEKAAGMLDKQGAYLVRQQDWQQSGKMATREVERSDIEIVIAQIRETIAREELRVHGVRQQQAAAELKYLEGKFTNRELFDWLAGQMRGLSRQMFNLAFEAASATERCFNYELGLAERFVRPGQWNDTRRGLLAAENLSLDLRGMESAYFKRNVREREMTKQFSLAQLDPLALIELRTTGRCLFQLQEAAIDLDHPGEYFRRIKMLSVLAPCVAGPYTSVPIKITQINNRVRVSTAKVPGAMTDAEAYAEAAGNDTRFKYNVGSIQSIETSRGDDDGGVFSLDANDERYLPFEGSGLCGTFVVELPPTLRGFDPATLSDLILNIRYTARDGGGAFRTMVSNGLAARLNAIILKAGRVGLFHAVDLRRDRPDVWHRLITTGAASLMITADDLPYFTSKRAVAITAGRVLARVRGAPASYAITVGGAPVNLGAPAEAELAGLLSASSAGIVLNAAVPLTIPQPALIEDMAVIINYSIG